MLNESRIYLALFILGLVLLAALNYIGGVECKANGGEYHHGRCWQPQIFGG